MIDKSINLLRKLFDYSGQPSGGALVVQDMKWGSCEKKET